MLDAARVFPWVHTWHGRDKSDLIKTLRSLDASDLAGKYSVMCQPKSEHRDDFYLRVLRQICDDPLYDYMLRLEDDVVVNRHVLHNACKWRATKHPKFGAGWLSVTNGLLEDSVNCRRLDGFMVREFPECHFAGGVLMSTAVLRDVFADMESRLRAGGDQFAPGCSVSRAVWKRGLRVFFHEPSIVKIDMSVPAYHPSRENQKDFWRQPFDPAWRA
jgi:hypothetical protein